MISKFIRVLWILFLVSALPCCCLYNSPLCEGDSEEQEIKTCIEILIRYGFKSEFVSDGSGRITLPRHIFNINWKKYKIDPVAIDFENGKCQMFDKEIFQKQNVIIYNSTSQDILANSWEISIVGKYSYEELEKAVKSCSLMYDNSENLWRVNYCFNMSNCKIDFTYCDSIDKLPKPETSSMIAQDIFYNILYCMEER